MDKRLTYIILGLLVLSNLVGVVTLLGVLPSPQAQPTQFPKAQPTASDATNYNAINAREITAATVIVNGTPVTWATPQPTATPLISGGSISITGIVTATAFVVNQTPVVPYSTPQAIVNGASNGYIRCNFNVITGTLTATPVAGATPLGYPWASLGAVSGDSARVYAIYAGGVFTVGVTNSALTPAPNATPADVEWCYYYVK